MIVNPKYAVPGSAGEPENAMFAGARSTKAGHRFYSPNTGRWLSKDPIDERGGMNLYGFVRNAPTRYFDSDGRQEITADSWGPWSGLLGPDGPNGAMGQYYRQQYPQMGVDLNAVWDTIISNLPKHPAPGFTVSFSTPIGTIGAVTVNVGFEISGDVKLCCSGNGNKYKFTGTISGTVYGYAGAKIPKVKVPSWDRSVDVGVSTLEPCGESDLEDITIDISGKLGLGAASVSLPLINWTAKHGWKGELQWPKGSIGLEGDVSVGLQGAGSQSGHLIYQ